MLACDGAHRDKRTRARREVSMGEGLAEIVSAGYPVWWGRAGPALRLIAYFLMGEMLRRVGVPMCAKFVLEHCNEHKP